MADKPKFKIICDGSVYGTRVVTPSGDEFVAKSVRFSHNADEIPTLIVEIIDFDFEADLNARHHVTQMAKDSAVSSAAERVASSNESVAKAVNALGERTRRTNDKLESIASELRR